MDTTIVVKMIGLVLGLLLCLASMYLILLGSLEWFVGTSSLGTVLILGISASMIPGIIADRKETRGERRVVSRTD